MDGIFHALHRRHHDTMNGCRGMPIRRKSKDDLAQQGWVSKWSGREKPSREVIDYRDSWKNGEPVATQYKVSLH